MKIALIGYGKMGKAIEEIALQRNHEIVLKIGSKNIEDFNAINLANVDVAIEFSTPEVAFINIEKLLQHNIPTISGTTAWLDQKEKIEKLCSEKDGTFLYASNFSIGVNLFFQLNQYLASLMNNYPEYKVSMEEVHHTAKKDAPSGTAITLAEQIIKEIKNKETWKNEMTSEQGVLPIISKREDPAPGTHHIFYDSEIDSIHISHIAHSRMGFAKGAVLAAEYIFNKKGIYNMSDVLFSNLQFV